MTLYLWHLTAMVALYGLVLAVGGPLPAPGTGLLWATRPVWLVLLAAVLTPLALLLSRFERPGLPLRKSKGGDGQRDAATTGRSVEAPSGRLAVVLGLVLAVLGLLGFTATGFAPLLDPEGGRLLILQAGPVQNLVLLGAGASLAWAAHAGATGRAMGCHERMGAVQAAVTASPVVPAASPRGCTSRSRTG